MKVEADDLSCGVDLIDCIFCQREAMSGHLRNAEFAADSPTAVKQLQQQARSRFRGGDDGDSDGAALLPPNTVGLALRRKSNRNVTKANESKQGQRDGRRPTSATDKNLLVRVCVGSRFRLAC